jgi:hypothetical protein
MTCIIGLSTSAYSNTIDGMTQEFGVANVVGQVGMFSASTTPRFLLAPPLGLPDQVSLSIAFNAACAVAPLILAPICEQVGRRQVYLSAFACFTLCFLFLALAKNGPSVALLRPSSFSPLSLLLPLPFPITSSICPLSAAVALRPPSLVRAFSGNRDHRSILLWSFRLLRYHSRRRYASGYLGHPRAIDPHVVSSFLASSAEDLASFAFSDAIPLIGRVQLLHLRRYLRNDRCSSLLWLHRPVRWVAMDRVDSRQFFFPLYSFPSRLSDPNLRPDLPHLPLSSFHLQMIASGTLFVAEVFFLKETRGQKILTDRARALRKETNDERYRAAAELENENIKELLKKSSTRAIMLLIKEPVLLFFGLWIAFAWGSSTSSPFFSSATILIGCADAQTCSVFHSGVTFLFLSVIPLTYSGNHGWSEGLSFSRSLAPSARLLPLADRFRFTRLVQETPVFLTSPLSSAASSASLPDCGVTESTTRFERRMMECPFLSKSTPPYAHFSFGSRRSTWMEGNAADAALLRSQSDTDSTPLSSSPRAFPSVSISSPSLSTASCTGWVLLSLSSSSSPESTQSFVPSLVILMLLSFFFHPFLAFDLSY